MTFLKHSLSHRCRRSQTKVRFSNYNFIYLFNEKDNKGIIYFNGVSKVLTSVALIFTYCYFDSLLDFYVLSIQPLSSIKLVNFFLIFRSRSIHGREPNILCGLCSSYGSIAAQRLAIHDYL